MPPTLLDSQAPQQHLPAAWARPASIGEATTADLASLPVFTGEGLARSDPEKYRKIALLFFRAGLGIRQIAELECCSPQTVSAIVARETQGATADEWRGHQIAELRALVALSARAAVDLLTTNEMAVAEAGIKGIAGLLREASAALDRLEDKQAGAADGGKPGEPQAMASAAAEHLRFLRARSREPISGQKIEAPADAPPAPAAGPRDDQDLARDLVPPPAPAASDQPDSLYPLGLDMDADAQVGAAAAAGPDPDIGKKRGRP